MEAPTIKVGDKVYKAKEPKVRLWRKIVAFNKQFGKVDDMHENLEAYEAMIDLIADCYGNPEITPEVVEDNIALSELMPTLEKVTGWVAHLLANLGEGVPGKN
jgi:hypothetical protein